MVGAQVPVWQLLQPPDVDKEGAADKGDVEGAADKGKGSPFVDTRGREAPAAGAVPALHALGGQAGLMARASAASLLRHDVPCWSGVPVSLERRPAISDPSTKTTPIFTAALAE